jgi:hypothetical protein
MRKLALLAIAIITLTVVNKCTEGESIFYVEYLAKDLETGENMLISGPEGYKELDTVWRRDNNTIDYNNSDSNTMKVVILQAY